jgi:hypothetical protein
MDCDDTLTIYTGNTAPNNHYPMTPWIAMHRMAHALLLPSNDIVVDQYSSDNITAVWREAGMMPITEPNTDLNILTIQKMNNDAMMNLLRLIMTMRSARKNSISNILDIFAELWTQHHFGGIKFLPAEQWESRRSFLDITNKCGWVDKCISQMLQNCTVTLFEHILTNFTNLEINQMLGKLEAMFTDVMNKLTAELKGKVIVL